jgi:hypothetical protein
MKNLASTSANVPWKRTAELEFRLRYIMPNVVMVIEDISFGKGGGLEANLLVVCGIF